jgi:hypothetical protein
MQPVADVVRACLKGVRGTDDSGTATPERSDYPALKTPS